MKNKGFTLIELLVVVIIMGVLASIGVKKYSATKTAAYAKNSLSILRQIGQARAVQIADNKVTAVTGQITNASNTGACDWATAEVSDLIACAYLSPHNWDRYKYNFYSCNGTAGGGCCGNGTADTVACAVSKTSSSLWYTISNTGDCVASSGVPPCFL